MSRVLKFDKVFKYQHDRTNPEPLSINDITEVYKLSDSDVHYQSDKYYMGLCTYLHMYGYVTYSNDNNTSTSFIDLDFENTDRYKLMCDAGDIKRYQSAKNLFQQELRQYKLDKLIDQ